MKSREDAILVRWTSPSGRAKRLVFEPRSGHLGVEKVTQLWTGKRWKTVNSQIIDRVVIESNRGEELRV